MNNNMNDWKNLDATYGDRWNQNISVVVLSILFGLALAVGWKLIADRMLAPDHPWFTITLMMIGLSALTGCIAGLVAQQTGRFSPCILGFIAQAGGAFILISLVSGGVSSPWTMGFWSVAAVGWVPGYLWFLAATFVVKSLWDRSRKRLLEGECNGEKDTIKFAESEK